MYLLYMGRFCESGLAVLGMPITVIKVRAMWRPRVSPVLLRELDRAFGERAGLVVGVLCPWTSARNVRQGQALRPKLEATLPRDDALPTAEGGAR